MERNTSYLREISLCNIGKRKLPKYVLEFINSFNSFSDADILVNRDINYEKPSYYFFFMIYKSIDCDTIGGDPLNFLFDRRERKKLAIQNEDDFLKEVYKKEMKRMKSLMVKIKDSILHKSKNEKVKLTAEIDCDEFEISLIFKIKIPSDINSARILGEELAKICMIEVL